MSLLTSIVLIACVLYAVLPYLCIYLARSGAEAAGRNFARELLTGTVAAMAAFCVIAPSISLFSFDLYLALHAVLTLVGLAVVVWRYRQSEAFRRPVGFKSAWPVLTLIVCAFAVRWVPLLWAGHSLGGDDARFHNILAEKILIGRATADTWAPFAHVPVLYPQASHVLVAFLADLTGRPVSDAFNILFPIVGGLSVGIIYLIAGIMFGNRRSALWAAAVYAFLPLWGSLDYFRWGGLPNALAMLFLCFAILIILEALAEPSGDQRGTGILPVAGDGRDARPTKTGPSHDRIAHATRSSAGASLENLRAPAQRRQLAILGSVLCLVAIQMTHHYTLLVAGIFLGFGIVFTADRELRRMLLIVAALSLLFCLPLVLAFRLTSGIPTASTSLLVFREAPLTLLDCIGSLNPVFVFVFAVVMLAARKRPWTPLQLLMLAWFAGLLVAFVGLEYLYRGATLLLTRFLDCHTALTPSRLASDLAYPMSLLCGFIPLAPVFEPRRRLYQTLFVLAAIVTVALVWTEQRHTGVNPDHEEAGRWLRDHTPTRCMVVGTFPQLEYLSWRETSQPPLPASEPRNSPAVTWKAYTQTYEEWLMWETINRRPVYFLFSSGEPAPPFLKQVFSNPSVVIMVRD